MNGIMKMPSLRSPLRNSLTLALIAVVAAACSSSDAPTADVTQPNGEDYPVSDPTALLEGAPDNSTLPDEGKADATYPAKFSDLMKTQSPVRNQRSRGVCSIFSTVALMEHLYIAEGTIKTPDFSEQFLQWSVKKEVGAYKDVEGSNPDRNVEAINRFGITDEGAWAYDARPWNTTNDPECTGGDKLPVKCYTNGEPPASALAAPRYVLPRGRYVNSSDTSIKAFMLSKKQAVTMTGKFFYQAWNHGASALPVNSAYSRKGYVLYPNAKDKEASLKHPAGHSVLLVGWDDTLEVQTVDEAGKMVVDSAGKPVMEKGFFIFKNSWAATWATESAAAPGYGFISYRYVKEFGSIYASDLPVLKTTPEVCNDKKDNDLDGKIDCDDTDCKASSICTTPGNSYSNNTAANIPDGVKTGLKSTIDIADAGLIEALSVTVDITHPYRGDVTVKLVNEAGKEAVLIDREGGGEDNIKKTFSLSSFNGLESKGKWTLVVIDNAKGDAGKLNSWSMQVSRCTGACSTGTAHYESKTTVAIPDGVATGVFQNLEVPDAGTIKGLSVNVDITHPVKGDLTIRLQKIGNPAEAILMTADASDGPFTPRTFSVPDFLNIDMKGTWRLTVVDEGKGDAGSLKSWSLDFIK